MFPAGGILNGFAEKVTFSTEPSSDDATKEILQDTLWADVCSAPLSLFAIKTYNVPRVSEELRPSLSCSAT